MVHCTGRCKEPQFTAHRGLTLTAAFCQVNQQYAKQSGYIGNLPAALKGSQHSALLLPVFRQESLNHLPIYPYFLFLLLRYLLVLLFFQYFHQTKHFLLFHLIIFHLKNQCK